jgi:magnesium chelatase subunit I
LYFPNPEKVRKQKQSTYSAITNWFGTGTQLDLLSDADEKSYQASLEKVPGLKELVEKHTNESSKYLMMEFALHGLAEFSMLSKNSMEKGLEFGDLLSSMFTMPEPGEEGYIQES